MKKVILSLFVLFFTVSFLSAQIELGDSKVKWKFSVDQKGDEAVISCQISVVDHWHVGPAHVPKTSFTLPTLLNFKKSSNFKLLGEILEPKPIFKHDEEIGEDLVYHEGTVVLKQKIKILSTKDFAIDGLFSFQTCNDVKCLPPFDSNFSLKLKGVVIEGINETKDSVKETKAVVSDLDDNENIPSIHKVINEKEVVMGVGHKKEDRSMWTIFILSFISGLAALLTPCVFPMIPMTVSYFTKQSKSKAHGIKNALLYGLSIIIIYILLGTVVTRVFGAEVLNEMSTNPTFNIVFFLILAIFAISFLGAFEIRMPNSWLNKADKASDRGGVVGIFFMALALALVSFSCTGPIVGTLLVEAASIGGIAPFVGMFGFSIALALPFGLFAAFPGWMNTLPKSGGWLNSVKVVLGFLELALAFKFLSNADLAVQGHFLERELFLAIWIGIFGVLALYLFGFIKLPHDSPLERLSVGRALFGTFVFIFVIYMIPGMFGAPLKLISAFPPPSNYSESPLGFGGSKNSTNSNEEIIEGTHLGPQGLMVFDDYDLAYAYAQKVDKPLFVDFTGHNCVNCRKMEESVWGEKGIIENLRNNVVIVSLHVDERIPLPKSEQKVVELVPGNKKLLETTGDKWMYMEISKYKAASQPFYVMLGPDGKDLPIGSADYEHHSNPKDFKKWIDKGLELYKK